LGREEINTVKGDFPRGKKIAPEVKNQRCFVPMGEGMKLQKYLKTVKLPPDGCNYIESKLEFKAVFYAFCIFFLL
jgi:hypothetical protein